ncbi:hypothetical protein K9M59_02465 [Candidatus Gracilibacteria bacterium]|nr:hypothetical protein [Candidatus Gracilibacteria bacterium]
MGLKKFNQLWRIDENINDEKSRFVNRINGSLFSQIDRGDREGYTDLFDSLCYWLGKNTRDVILGYNVRDPRRQFDPFYNDKIPPLRHLSGDDFETTLKIIVLIHAYFKSKTSQKIKIVDASVNAALSNSLVDIGIRWTDGMFYPLVWKNLTKLS